MAAHSMSRTSHAAIARAIIQAGIAEVYVDKSKLTADFLERWEQDMKISTEMFEESGVAVKVIDDDGNTKPMK